MSENVTPKDALLEALRAERKKSAEARSKARSQGKRLKELRDDRNRLWAINKELGEQLSQMRLELARARVLRAHNIPTQLDKYITGTTLEELENSAIEVMAAYRRTPIGLRHSTKE
jgi:hypothetical protein